MANSYGLVLVASIICLLLQCVVASAGSEIRNAATVPVLGSRSVGPAHSSSYEISSAYPPESTCLIDGARSCSDSATKWTSLLTAIGPSAREDAAMAYDRADGYTVLFGGWDGFPGPSDIYNDTWEFRAGVWVQLFPAASPPARYDALMATDPVSGCVILFGGTGISRSYNDTWQYCHGFWTNETTGSAPYVTAASMTGDPPCGCILLFGGGTGFAAYSNTWEWEDGSWSELSLTVSPSPRWNAGMAYDAQASAVILFSGDNQSGAMPNDTWEFVNQSWSEVRTPSSPPPSILEVLVSAPSESGVLLFGTGQGTCGNSTWLFAGGTWTNVSQSGAPAPRCNAAAALDSAEDEDVLFGGLSSTNRIWGDTWVFGGLSLEFVAVGLPVGLPWAVSLNGTENSSIGEKLDFEVGPGSYDFAIPPAFAQSADVRFSARSPNGTTLLSTASIELFVIFVEQVWLNTSERPLGSGTVSPNPEWVDNGTLLRLVATPGPQFRFTAWAGSGNGSYSGTESSYSVSATNPLTEIAVFASALTYPIHVNESGLPAKSSWSFVIDGYNASSTLSEITLNLANGTYGWEVFGPGAVSSEIKYSSAEPSGLVTIAGAGLALNVVFMESVLVTVLAAPASGGYTDPTSGWVEAGASVSLFAAPAPGHVFREWIGQGASSYSGSNVSARLIIESPVSEVADFINASSPFLLGGLSTSEWVSLALFAGIEIAVPMTWSIASRRSRSRASREFPAKSSSEYRFIRQSGGSRDVTDGPRI